MTTPEFFGIGPKVTAVYMYIIYARRQTLPKVICGRIICVEMCAKTMLLNYQDCEISSIHDEQDWAED